MTTATDVPATPRTPRAITQPRAETAGKLDRRDALGAMFHALDVNGDGRVDVDEAVHAACGVCPTMTESEVDDWFKSMDVSDTGFLDESEYVAGMMNVTRSMTEAEFATSARDTIARTARKVKHPRYYFHRDDARGYLGEELVPLLEKGLDALLREVESERLRVASGADWDEDGYVPDEWRPTRPLRFLGEWLRANSAKGVAERAAREAEEAAAEAKRTREAEMAARGGKPRRMHELSREEKLEMCFDAMDRNGDGVLTFDEMLRVCRKIDPGRGREEAASMVQWMDVNSDGQVDKAEYETAMLAVMEHLDDEVFDLGIERTLTAVTFANASRAEKLRMVFDKCDADADGRLDLDELRSLANALIVGGDEQKARRTMKWLDADGDDVVTFEEFVAPMLAATAPVDDDRFDAAVRRILAADGDAAEPDAADALHAKLAAYVASLETHATTKQVSVRDFDVLLKDKTKKIGIVDCRPARERAVSALDAASRGAAAARTSVVVALGDVAFEDAVDNNIAALVDSASAELADALETCDVVVCFSAFGAEAGAAAPLVAEKVGATDCRNLCGGIVAWFNAGFALVDPNTGTASEAVHPGSKTRAGLVRPRRNAFKFPKEGEEGGADAE